MKIPPIRDLSMLSVKNHFETVYVSLAFFLFFFFFLYFTYIDGVEGRNLLFTLVKISYYQDFIIYEQCQKYSSNKCHSALLKTNHLRVNFHDVVNMKPSPINAVVRLRRASDRLVVAAFFMICVSSDSLLKSSPVRVTSKKAIS